MKSPTGAEVKELRAEFNMTQTEFGALFNRKFRMVANWEAGTPKMPSEVWEFYLVYFGKQKPRRFDDGK